MGRALVTSNYARGVVLLVATLVHFPFNDFSDLQGCQENDDHGDHHHIKTNIAASLLVEVGAINFLAFFFFLFVCFVFV